MTFIAFIYNTILSDGIYIYKVNYYIIYTNLTYIAHMHSFRLLVDI